MLSPCLSSCAVLRHTGGAAVVPSHVRHHGTASAGYGVSCYALRDTACKSAERGDGRRGVGKVERVAACVRRRHGRCPLLI
eukprot:5371614-Prymnesium_polylepis.2